MRSSRWWRVLRWPLGVGVAGLLTAIVAVAALYAGAELPDEPPLLESSVVLAADGTELATFAKDERRIAVPLAEVAPVVVDALIAAEDQRFYDHAGVDPLGLARAVWNNLRGGATQGGSTITQQLVKNAYVGSERTVLRKVREALLATKLEARDDKDDILESYLNTVYFGRGAYGVEVAANTYFGVPAAELDVAQAALLVAMLRAPEATDPERDPELATRRRDGVIDAMVDTGALGREEAEAAKRRELGALPRASDTTLTAGIGAHFVEWVRAVAIEQVGESELYGGGLTIHTTLDPAHQRAAEAAVAEQAAETDADAALVSVDALGAVTAHVGSVDPDAVKVDLARGRDGGGTGRQPGSAFKPFALAAALAADDGPTLGTPVAAPGTETFDVDGTPWQVSNYDGRDLGVVDLRAATARSSNTAYARLALEVGPERIADAAAAAGITSEVPAHPSIVLGTAEVSPLELAGAYNTFATGGTRVTVFPVRSIERGEEVLWRPELPAQDAAIDPGVAHAVTDALEDVIARGTATAADIGRPAAGKTGTTQGSGDAWFAGYTPFRTTVVWFGHPEGPTLPVTTLDGAPVTGGGLPARTWATFMAAATAEDPPEPFPEPPAELLDPPPPPERTLVLSPDRGVAGTTTVATGTGYDACTAGWWVTADGPVEVPPPEVDVDADARSVTLRVAPEAVPAPVRIVAHCDDGVRSGPVAAAVFTVEPPPEEPGERTGRDRERLGTGRDGEGADERSDEPRRGPGATTTTTVAPTTTLAERDRDPARPAPGG